MRHYIITTITALLIAGCAKQAVNVSDAYVRAPVAQRDVTAAFMTIDNGGQADIKLQSASSPAAERVELHQHTHSDGMMRMRQVESIDIPARQTLALEPGGYHMMLIGVAPGLRDQDNVELTLNFSNGETLTVTAPVRSVLAD